MFRILDSTLGQLRGTEQQSHVKKGINVTRFLI